MTQIYRKLFLFLPVLLFILNELIRTYIRPIYGRKRYGIWSEISGWLPNFLAAFGLVVLGAVLLKVIQESARDIVNRKVKWITLGLVDVVALVGLIQHEFAQKGTGLFYDLADIYATIIGVILGSAVYYFATLSHDHQ